MTKRRETTRSPLVGAVVSVAIVAVTTALLRGIQVWLSSVEGHTIRPFEMGYLLPVALITLIWGFFAGLLALAACSLAAAFFLMPGPGFHVNNLSDMAGLGFLAVTGLFMVAAVDTARRNHYLRREAQARAGREALVGQIARMARSSFDPAEIQYSVLASVAQSLNADRAYLIVRDYVHETTAISAEWHQSHLLPLSQSDISTDFWANVLTSDAGRVLTDSNSNHPLLAGTPPDEIAGLGLTSVIHVPLASGGTVNAIFGVAMADGERDWSDDEIALVEVVAAEGRAAVDTARLVLRERNIAHALQSALLPHPHRDIGGLDIATFYKAALAEASIGGDFCDIFRVRGTQWAMIVGDVSGKGLLAASQIATVRNMLRAVLYQDECISCAVARLNAMLADHRLLRGFVTLFAGVYDVSNGHFTYVNCGHEPALLRRKDGAITEMGPTGSVLGVIENAVYEQESVHIHTGDVLFVYTDGASEAGPNRTALLGIEGLAQMLGEQPKTAAAADIVASMSTSIQAYAEGKLHDDICLLVVVSVDASL